MTCFPYLGSEISRLREARGMTPKNLAQLLGVREITILNIEAGKFFKADILEQILTSLGCRLTIIPDNGSKSLESLEDAMLDKLASKRWTRADYCASRCQRSQLGQQKQEDKK